MNARKLHATVVIGGIHHLADDKARGKAEAKLPLLDSALKSHCGEHKQEHGLYDDESRPRRPDLLLLRPRLPRCIFTTLIRRNAPAP